jgi:hypothetical protein
MHIENEETFVGFNLVMKIFIYSVTITSISGLIEDKNWIILGVSIISFLAVHLSSKCTVAGYYKGIDCYFFRFYTNRCIYWENVTELGIHESTWSWLWSYEIGYYSSDFFIIRCLYSNFDKVAEIISYNTHINSKIRQEFITYVNMRKQQSNWIWILPKIIEYAILSCLIGFFIKIAVSNGWV